MVDVYLEIENRVGKKIETSHEDIFLTWFLDSGLYKRYHINSQVEFNGKNGRCKYRADFVLYELDGSRKLVVEIDGLHHTYNQDQREYDIKRDQWFKNIGYEVLRFRNDYMLCEFGGARYEL